MHTKSAADANPLAKEYEDITLNCRDCNAEFIFSAGEQEFYHSKGWENQPTRCVECKNAQARLGEPPSAGPVCYAYRRASARARLLPPAHTEGGDGAAAGGGYGGGGGGGAPVCYAFRGRVPRGDACRPHTEGGGGGGGGSRLPPQFRAVLRVPEGRVHARGLLPLLARPQRSGAPALEPAVLRVPEGRVLARGLLPLLPRGDVLSKRERDDNTSAAAMSTQQTFSSGFRPINRCRHVRMVNAVSAFRLPRNSYIALCLQPVRSRARLTHSRPSCCS